MPNVPHRIASKHTVRSRKPIISNPVDLGVASGAGRARPHSLLADDSQSLVSPPKRRSGVFDDSPIVDLDADDDLEALEGPSISDHFANRGAGNGEDSDTMKRAGGMYLNICCK